MLRLREATQEDMDLLYRWANDPEVRKQSFRTEPIPYETHVNWFRRMMDDPAVLQFILEEDGVPAGQIRLNTDGGEAEIGYSIAAECRGRGLGRQMLRMTAELVREEHPEIRKLTAKVKPGNGSSNALCESEGYEKAYTCYTLKTGPEAEETV